MIFLMIFNRQIQRKKQKLEKQNFSGLWLCTSSILVIIVKEVGDEHSTYLVKYLEFYISLKMYGNFIVNFLMFLKHIKGKYMDPNAFLSLKIYTFKYNCTN